MIENLQRELNNWLVFFFFLICVRFNLSHFNTHLKGKSPFVYTSAELSAFSQDRLQNLSHNSLDHFI